MNFSPFSCPIFLGHPEARGRCSQGERVLYGRDPRRSGGTGKAEAAKQPGAGIGPKQCPGKCAAEKECLPMRVKISMRSKLASTTSWERDKLSSFPTLSGEVRQFCEYLHACYCTAPLGRYSVLGR